VSSAALMLAACGSNPTSSASKGLGFDPVASPKFSYPVADPELPPDCSQNPLQIPRQSGGVIRVTAQAVPEANFAFMTAEPRCRKLLLLLEYFEARKQIRHGVRIRERLSANEPLSSRPLSEASALRDCVREAVIAVARWRPDGVVNAGVSHSPMVPVGHSRQLPPDRRTGSPAKSWDFWP
jgi:hypothetical protein